MPYVAKVGLVGAQEHAGPQRPACCSRLAVMSQAHALTALDGQLLRKNALDFHSFARSVEFPRKPMVLASGI